MCDRSATRAVVPFEVCSFRAKQASRCCSESAYQKDTKKMETTSLFSSDKTSIYASIDGVSSSSNVNRAAQLIRDAYLGFQYAPVEGYYDVS